MQGDSEKKNDSQKIILEGMADLKKEIGKLRSDYKKLSKKIGQIEIQGTQDQLSSLNDALLETNRFLASLAIGQFNLFLDQWLQAQLGASGPAYTEVRDFITFMRAKSLQEVTQSHTPLAVADQFQANCIEFFKSHGLRPFSG
jgi:hypothetical protein